MFFNHYQKKIKFTLTSSEKSFNYEELFTMIAEDEIQASKMFSKYLERKVQEIYNFEIYNLELQTIQELELIEENVLSRRSKIYSRPSNFCKMDL